MNNLIKRLISLFFSRTPKLYVIPFGPIKGMRLFTSFDISPRMLFGFDEPWVGKIAKLYLTEGDTVFDVGAHIGYTSLLFAKLVGGTGRVHAFELLPTVASNYLSKTISVNGFEQIITSYPVGLSDKEESLSIFVGHTMMGSLDSTKSEAITIEQCRVVTLDKYANQHYLGIPKLIKVDIERAEIQFLEGAISFIKKHQPILLIEFHNIDLLKQGYQILTDLGYELASDKGKIDLEVLDSLSFFHKSVIAIPKL